MWKFLKLKLANWLLSDILCAPDVFRIVKTSKKDGLIIGGEPASEQQIRNLKAEVKFFCESEVWKMMTSTLVSHARKTMIEKSTTFDDMWSGKMILYAVSIQNSILDAIRKSKIGEN